MKYLKLFENEEKPLYKGFNLKVFRDDNDDLIFQRFTIQKDDYENYAIEPILSELTEYIKDYKKDPKFRAIELTETDRLRFDISRYLYHLWRIYDKTSTPNFSVWRKIDHLYSNEIGYDIFDVVKDAKNWVN